MRNGLCSGHVVLRERVLHDRRTSEIRVETLTALHPHRGACVAIAQGIMGYIVLRERVLHDRRTSEIGVETLTALARGASVAKERLRES